MLTIIFWYLSRGEYDRRFRQLCPTPIKIDLSLVGKIFQRRLKPSDPIQKFWFPTDRPTKRSKMNSNADSSDFAELRPKSVGVQSEKFPTTIKTFYPRIQSEFKVHISKSVSCNMDKFLRGTIGYWDISRSIGKRVIYSENTKDT